MLLQVIARGGMGSVYKAGQVSLNRILLVRWYVPAGSPARIPDAFPGSRPRQRPTSIIPNIVPIHEEGEHQTSLFQHELIRGLASGVQLQRFLIGQPAPVGG